MSKHTGFPDALRKCCKDTCTTISRKDAEIREIDTIIAEDTYEVKLITAHILDFLSENIKYFPAFAFVALILAGISIPFSEDLIIIGGALVCRADIKLLVPCLIAILLGVYIGDIASYFVGYLFKRGTIKLKIVSTALKHRYVRKLRTNLDKHGFWTFLVCRFIPFGVRNTLFMTCGFFRLKFPKFLLYDVCTLLISVNVLFWLVYAFGEASEKPLRIVGIILFIVLVCTIGTLFIRIITTLIKKRRAA